MNHRFAHLTRDGHCLAALDRELAKRALGAGGVVRDHFAAGFVAGWQERSIDDHARGLTTVGREYLAALEVAAEQKEAGQ